MDIYIASHSKEFANEAAQKLSGAGHQIISSWHYGAFLSTAEHTQKECEEKAWRDYEEVSNSDLLMLFSGPDKYSGGKFVEAGIAIGMGKKVCVIGHRENMLLYLESIPVFESVEAWIENH